MCISSLTQIVYGIIMFACLILTVVALFTPGWRQFSDDLKKTTSTLNVPLQSGILPYACRMPDATPSSNAEDYCNNWWQNLQQWEKAVVILMMLAVVAEIAALGWNAFTCCACCCKKYLIHPLTPLSLLVSGLLLASVIIYGTNNKSIIDDIRSQGAGQPIPLNTTTEVGYSFWLTVAALILAIADGVVAVVTVFFGERMC